MDGRGGSVRSSGPRVLAQTGRGSSPTFNLAIASATAYLDVDLSVKLHSVSGEIDQGGGLVWRLADPKNYYVARYNPLETNFRLYKVVAGKRTQLATADVDAGPGWHALRVTMRGDAIACSLDEKPLLEARDGTFPKAGRIGLWTKADAATRFDTLAVKEPGPAEKPGAKEPGAKKDGRPHDESAVGEAARRARRTKAIAHMKSIYEVAEALYNSTGTWPRSIAAMVDARDADGTPAIASLPAQPKDPWSHDYLYSRKGDRPTIACLGSDGREGGEGEAADLVYPEADGSIRGRATSEPRSLAKRSSPWIPGSMRRP